MIGDNQLKYYDTSAKKEYHLIQCDDGKNGIKYNDEDKAK